MHKALDSVPLTEKKKKKISYLIRHYSTQLLLLEHPYIPQIWTLLKDLFSGHFPYLPRITSDLIQLQSFKSPLFTIDSQIYISSSATSPELQTPIYSVAYFTSLLIDIPNFVKTDLPTSFIYSLSSLSVKGHNSYSSNFLHCKPLSFLSSLFHMPQYVRKSYWLYHNISRI